MFDLYIVNTAEHFRSKWNNLKSDTRTAEVYNMGNVKQKFLGSHFSYSDHQGFLTDVDVRLTDKTHASDPIPRGNFTG